MRILIIEDEPPIADYIAGMCKNILGRKLKSIQKAFCLDEAMDHVNDPNIDLCFLDLNLSGENGFEFLQRAVSGAFHTIIISAYTEQAVKAFEYGVLDFVPKPFNEARFRKAIERYFARDTGNPVKVKYLSVRKQNRYHFLPIKTVRYFKAAGIYVDAHLNNGKIEILDKTMAGLEQILPEPFLRIHRSIIVDISYVQSYGHISGGNYAVVLRNGISLPLSRQRYKQLQQFVNAKRF